MNLTLQERLNPSKRRDLCRLGLTVSYRGQGHQTENNYDRDRTNNGDIGQITKIDLVEKEVIVAFDQRK